MQYIAAVAAAAAAATAAQLPNIAGILILSKCLRHQEVILTNMSAAPGVLCLICMECFSKDDCVDSTSCGHIYHSACIQNWLTRSKQCPKCRIKCRGNRKLFLDFDDTGNEAAKQFEKHYLALQKDYTEVNESNKQFKEENRIIKN
uniref:RING-type domain-containing protein n=1 Tax=Glossina palpalis gambiensis TaxID=67801 RepID=A0A1B0AP56_9MUSC